MEILSTNSFSISNPSLRLSTENLSIWHRREWLREVLGREYANVEITPPKNDQLFAEINIFPWMDLRLSVIHSNSITIERRPSEPTQISQDVYLAVVLLSGKYQLEQNGREVFLEPGDMTIYDATRPHRLYCPSSFSKLIVSIPRDTMRDRLPSVEHCTALKIDGKQAEGLIASKFIQTVANQADHLSAKTFQQTSDSSLDLITLALKSACPMDYYLSRSRFASIQRVKRYVENNLTNPKLDTELIVNGTKLSARYINELFADEGTSLMRYVWDKRLQAVNKNLMDLNYAQVSISEIAFRWGFNDFSHFSRSFKLKFGITPRSVKLITRSVL